MVDDRAPLGLMIAALGAAVLALSIFVPWYGLSITQTGATAARQQLISAARQYGNTTLKSEVSGVGERFNSLVGRRIATVSAHQSLKRVSLILLVLAGVAFLASLLRLADMRGMLYATGGQIALIGVMAAGVVLFRIAAKPGVAGSLIALSVDWGAWLALGSAAAIVGGGLIAGSEQARARSRAKVGPAPATAQMPPRF
jgi:hypothetical protein